MRKVCFQRVWFGLYDCLNGRSWFFLAYAKNMSSYNDVTLMSHVGATYLKMCGTVSRIQWYLQWLCSSIRSEVVVAQRIAGHCSGRRGS